MEQDPSEMKSLTPESFEETYRQFAPLMRRIAVRSYGIPLAEAESLVFDVFATYLTNPAEVNNVGPYLVAGICDAARHYLGLQPACPAEV